MRRLTALLLVTGLLLVGSTAAANEHPPAFPEHAHILLIDLDATFFPDAFPDFRSVRKCVDVANNRALRLNAHHEHVHFGMGNVGLQHGDNLMIPTAPFPIPVPPWVVPWEDCEEFLEVTGLG